MKYGIVLFPSKKLQDIANSYRKRYDPNYALIPPHLTLRTPFEVSEDEISGVVATLERAFKRAETGHAEDYKIQFLCPRQ